MPTLTLQQIGQLIAQAAPPADAAEPLAEWLGEGAGAALVVLLDAEGAPSTWAASPGFSPDAELSAWMRRDALARAWSSPQPHAGGLIVPLWHPDRPFGLIWLAGTPAAALVDTAVLLAGWLTARLHSAWREATWRQRLDTLYAVSETLNQGSEVAWHAVEEHIRSSFNVPAYYVALFDPDRQRVTFPILVTDDLPDAVAPMPPCGLVAAVLRHGFELHIRDREAEAERLIAFGVQPCDAEPNGTMRSWLSVPIRDRQRQVIGVVSLQHDLPDAFTDGDLALLMALATPLAQALESAALVRVERDRRQVINLLMEVGQLIASPLPYDEILERILEDLPRVLGFDSATVLVYRGTLPAVPDAAEAHTSDQQLEFALHASFGGWTRPLGATVHVRHPNPVALVFNSRQPLVVGDVRAHPGWAHHAGTDDRTDLIRAWLGAPLLVKDTIIGVITLESAQANFFTERDASTLFALARQIGVAIENVRLTTQLHSSIRTLETRTRRLTTIQYITAIIASSLDQDTVLSSTAELVTELFRMNYCAIALIEGERVRVSAEYPEAGMVGLTLATHDSSHYEHLMTYRTVVAVDDGDALMGDRLISAMMGQLGVQSAMLVPLIMRDQVIGLLGIGATQREHAFTDEERESFITIASYVALAVYNADLYTQAVSANRLKSEFLATISHELRTPLNAIIGYSDMLLAGTYGEMPTRQRDRLVRVHNSGKHLLALIDDVLDLSKIESGQLRLQSVPVRLSDLVPEAIAQVAPMAEQKQLALDVTVSNLEPRLFGEPERVHQVIVSLLDNAVKFTREGGVQVRVVPVRIHEGKVGIGDSTLDVAFEVTPPPALGVPDGDWVALLVSDTGIGIRPEDQPIIFEAFRQVDGSTMREYGGTGLGLAIARRLVALHNGYIWVESALGRGSTFYALFPALEPAAIDLPLIEDGESRLTILVVDDDPSVFQLVRDYLDEETYRVIGVNNPLRALEIAQAAQPDAILADVMMPGMTGWEFLRSLKADPRLSDIPVIILSVMNEKTTGYFLGAADYLIKPLYRDTLIESLTRVLHIRPAEPILVVDDGEDDRTLLTAWLERSGYTVQTAASGAEALRRCEQQIPSLILLDLQLPDMSGLDVLERLRADPYLRLIPVIVVTAKALDLATEMHLRESVVRLLPKADFNGSALIELVETALSQSRAKRVG